MARRTSPIFKPSAANRHHRRRRLRRRRLAAVAALLVAVVLAVIAIPWVVDRIDSAGRADPRGALVAELEVASEAVGETLETTVVVPKGARAKVQDRPLLVFLHGRGGDEESYLGSGAMFTALARLGERAPIVAFPDGGDHSYWHDRDDGAWDRYLLREVIPEVARAAAADPRRVAVGGISMGGFGAFDLALHHPGRFCAAGGHSPALWSSAEETAPEAFDDAEDFSRNDVVGEARNGAPAFERMPLWIDAGDEDSFQPGARDFVAALRDEEGPLTARIDWPGGHDSEYWDRHWPQYFRFYADALRACRV